MLSDVAGRRWLVVSDLRLASGSGLMTRETLPTSSKYGRQGLLTPCLHNCNGTSPGMLSDVAGRRWLVVSGLALNAAGLMTAAFGAGFGGALLGPDVRQAGADSVTGLIVRYGYLVLSSCLMGTGGGLMYPVMAAAVADHAKSTQSQTQRGGGNRGGDGYAGGSAGVVVRGGEQGRVSLEVAMATYRFWRDLGYAVGAVGGPIADVLGVEVAALVFAGVCGVVAAVVMVRYEERGHVEEGEEGVGVRVGRELG